MGTNGGPQDVLFLTEVGLYRLLGMSRKPIAKKFQKWVANVIKEIRLNNKYELECQIKDVIEKSSNDNDVFRHKTILNSFDNKPGVYIGKIKKLENNKMIIKIGSSVTKNLIFLYNQRNNQYYPIILYYNNILKKNILLVNHY
jgi:hypothetical protein